MNGQYDNVWYYNRPVKVINKNSKFYGRVGVLRVPPRIRDEAVGVFFQEDNHLVMMTQSSVVLL